MSDLDPIPLTIATETMRQRHIETLREDLYNLGYVSFPREKRRRLNAVGTISARDEARYPEQVRKHLLKDLAIRLGAELLTSGCVRPHEQVVADGCVEIRLSVMVVPDDPMFDVSPETQAMIEMWRRKP